MIRLKIECFAIQQGIINVLVFDGENKPVRDFIKDVINGALVVPADCEKRYVRAVFSRLKGTARSSTYGRTFSNLNKLNNHLMQRYPPRKAYSWYIRGKIRQVYPTQNYLSPISLKVREIIFLVNLF